MSDVINITVAELAILKQALKDASLILGRISSRRNAYATREKVIERGSHVGRPRKRNDKRIAKLRARGLTVRAIAKLEGVSTAAVQRSLQEALRKFDEVKP